MDLHGDAFLSWDSNLILFLYLFFLFYPDNVSTIRVYTMTLLRPWFIVGDVDFEPRTSASEVWCVTKEPPHLLTT